MFFFEKFKKVLPFFSLFKKKSRMASTNRVLTRSASRALKRLREEREEREESVPEPEHYFVSSFPKDEETSRLKILATVARTEAVNFGVGVGAGELAPRFLEPNIEPTRQRQRVKFSSDTKEFDGLNLGARAFEKLVDTFCRTEDDEFAVEDALKIVKTCVPKEVSTYRIFLFYVLRFFFKRASQCFPQMQARGGLGTLHFLGEMQSRAEDLHGRLARPCYFTEFDGAVNDLLFVPPRPILKSVPILAHGGGSCMKIPVSAASRILNLVSLLDFAVLRQSNK